MAAGCYLDGDRTKAVTTAEMVGYDATSGVAAVAGHAISHGGNDHEKGDDVNYSPLSGPPVGDVTRAGHGLPGGSCALMFGDGVITSSVASDYTAGGRLWLVDCCDDDGIGSVYQGATPDWTGGDDGTTWPEAFPPAQWGWDTEFQGLPVQRLRDGAMGDVVAALGAITFVFMFLISGFLVWREFSMWSAERGA